MANVNTIHWDPSTMPISLSLVNRSKYSESTTWKVTVSASANRAGQDQRQSLRRPLSSILYQWSVSMGRTTKYCHLVVQFNHAVDFTTAELVEPAF